MISLLFLEVDSISFNSYLTPVILVVGLKPQAFYDEFQNDYLGMNGISLRDVLINVAGFIPLGFLMVGSYLALRPLARNTSMVIAVTTAGLAISLLIETVQYLAEIGRYSSALDLATNTLGTLLGVMAYMISISRQPISPHQ